MAPVCRSFLCVGAALLLVHRAAGQEGDGQEGADDAEVGTCSVVNTDACSQEQRYNINMTQQLVEEGNALAGKEDYEGALKLYKLALSIDNASEWSANPMVNTGLALKSMGRVDEGIDYLRQGVRLNPSLFHGQYNLANALFESKKAWKEADAAYSAALLEVKPDMAHHVLIAYIRCLLSLYHYEDGRAALEGRDILYEVGKLTAQLIPVVRQMDEPPLDLVSLCSNALTIAGKTKESAAFSEWAVEKGLWKDVRQRPSNMDLEFASKVKAAPWWKSGDYELPDFLEELSESWKKLAKEFDTLQKNGKLKQPEDDGKSDFQWFDKAKGSDWRQLDLFEEGQKNFGNAKIAKVGARLFGDTAIKGDVRARVFYSAMMPGTRTVPRCGLSNLRLTCYLGLRVPNVESEKLGISVGGEVRGVKEGAWSCFDDSFEHAVWNEADEVFGAVVAQFRHPAAPKA